MHFTSGANNSTKGGIKVAFREFTSCLSFTGSSTCTHLRVDLQTKSHFQVDPGSGSAPRAVRHHFKWTRPLCPRSPTRLKLATEQSPSIVVMKARLLTCPTPPIPLR